MLPEGFPPPPWDTDNGPDDWTPYVSWAEFELCDLLYMRNEMPAGQVDDLLEIITVMNVMTGREGPFTTHKDLYSTINATNLGDAPWSHFNLNYQGKKSANPSLWQTEDFCYLVCYDVLDTQSLAAMQDALNHFHWYWEIFHICGICSSLNLPHQHLLMHFIQMIRLFGAPNGLCLSIMELKHIKGVKSLWSPQSNVTN